LVQSSDLLQPEDCVLPETWDSNSRTCRVDCLKDSDCRIQGMQCLKNRCQFSSERIAAANFCLEVINPKSSYLGKELCLNALQGKVVAIFFGLLA
jgi:hypothetical protein